MFGGFDQDFSSTISALALAVLIIAIVGIAIPHFWASHAAEKTLAFTIWVLLLFRYALWPIIALMGSLELPIRRLSGARDDKDENGEIAKQEILHAAEEGQAEGTVDADEVDMIESVMEFGETQAGEIMTPRTDIFALPSDTPTKKAIQEVVDAGHTRVPIYEDNLDKIIGILYAKDLLRYMDQAQPVGLREIMRKCFFVPETKLLDDLFGEFQARKVHMAIVLDEYGGTAGLITIEDVIEQIVGEISDEYDSIKPKLMHKVDEKTAEVDGRFYIDDLNDELDLEIPEDKDYDTVAGLVFSEMGHIPAVNERLKIYGAEFTVLAADERKISKLRVEVLKQQKDEED